MAGEKKIMLYCAYTNILISFPGVKELWQSRDGCNKLKITICVLSRCTEQGEAIYTWRLAASETHMVTLQQICIISQTTQITGTNKRLAFSTWTQRIGHFSCCIVLASVRRKLEGTLNTSWIAKHLSPSVGNILEYAICILIQQTLIVWEKT